MDRWNEHFVELLEGTKDRVVLEKEEYDRRETDREEKKGEKEKEEEEHITKEVIEHLKKLKKGKTPGE